MRQVKLGAMLVLLVLVGVLGANQPPKKEKKAPSAFAEARQRRLKGNYDEARTAYEAVAKKDEKLRPQALLGIARTYADAADFATAQKLIAEAVTAFPNDATLLGFKAHLQFERGQWTEAKQTAETALAKNTNELLARWTLARVLDAQGETEEAEKNTKAIVRYYTARSNADQDITDPDELLAVAGAGAENARRNNLSKQFSFILNEVLADALKADENLWPAEIMAGNMLLEKYNRPTAIEAYEKALTIHPKCLEAFVGKAHAAMLKYDIKEAEALIDQALRIAPKFAPALSAKATIDIMAGDWANAEKVLKLAREHNPRDPEYLGKLAAVYRIQNQLPQFDAILKEAESYDKKPAVFYSNLAEVLEDRKRYSLAEAFFRKALAARSNYAPPRNSLGMLMLRLGNEAEGREMLTKAIALDPFNVRTANTIKVLKHLDSYATKQTAHYEIRYDPKERILIDSLAEVLEETHAELKQQFGYEPPGRVLIEVFNSHDMFSGRTTGLPDLHTIGACTGKVVVMASPVAKGVRKPFHWGRVIRHEVTHIFNLIQTDYQCPHWLTEGLAVRNENMALSPQWLQTLRDRQKADTLFTLDTVLFGFVRPKTPDEWGLAYCQSKLYVDYLVKTHGEAAIAKLLAAYQANKSTAEAIPAACGVDQPTFEKGYKAYIAELLKPYIAKGPAKRVTKPLTFEELEKLFDNDPEDSEIACQYAEALIRRDKVREARIILDDILSRDKDHPGANLAMAKLLSRSGDTEKATELLNLVSKKHPNDVQVINALVRMHMEAKNLDEAAKALEHGRKVAPLDGDWLGQLARLYRETEESDKLIDVLKELISHDPDELDGRVKLAENYLKAKDYPLAEKQAKDALQIDVMNEAARRVLLEALKAQNKTAEIEKLERRYVAD
ncbi:MAG: tetratricopeptide repeat protein [Fimbriiglobus sp.]